MAKAKQESLPGAEDPLIAEVVNLMKNYVEARDARMDWGKKEGDFKTRLLDSMHRHKLKTYKVNGMHAYIESGDENVKVSVQDPDEKKKKKEK